MKTIIKLSILALMALCFSQCSVVFSHSFPKQDYPGQEKHTDGINKSAVRQLYVLKMVECSQKFAHNGDSLDVRKFMPSNYCQSPLSSSFYYIFLYLMEDGTAYYGSTIQHTDTDERLRRGLIKRRLKLHRDRDRISGQVYKKAMLQKEGKKEKRPKLKFYNKRYQFEEMLGEHLRQYPIVEELYMGSYEEIDSNKQIQVSLKPNKWKIKFKKKDGERYYQAKFKPKRNALNKIDFSMYDPKYPYKIKVPKKQETEYGGPLDQPLIFTFTPVNSNNIFQNKKDPKTIKMIKVDDTAGELTTIKTETDSDIFKPAEILSYDLIFQKTGLAQFQPYFLLRKPLLKRQANQFAWEDFPDICR